MILHQLAHQSASRIPQALAISGPDGTITYGELDQMANRVARMLNEMGVQRGDRVGIWLDKSTRTVIAMQAVLRLGAAYVPLDSLSPASRIRTIIADCDVAALVTTASRAALVLTDELARVPYLSTDGVGGAQQWDDLALFSDEPLPEPSVSEHDLAYILYTSGSTGKPKGVCISHRNALAFVNWAVAEVHATAADRFSNHAPFHFDLSVFDLYAAFQVGAAVYLIPDGMSYLPCKLVEFLDREQISIWYSVPSVLILMMEQGGLLDLSPPALRAILFAGEPFPIKHLRRLHEHFPAVRLLNLYGPTETNVCTFYEVQTIEPERIKPVPIGKACSEDRVWAQKEDGTLVGVDEEGELMVEGATVMLGYWGQPPHGDKPYATGDIVRLQPDGDYMYVGRRDHMFKVRGYRVELGDIEAALETHLAIHSAAVIVHGSGMQARLVAFVRPQSAEQPALLEIKRHCAERLPRYMIVDDLQFLDDLPRTRNGKIDRIRLTEEYAAMREKKEQIHATV